MAKKLKTPEEVVKENRANLLAQLPEQAAKEVALGFQLVDNDDLETLFAIGESDVLKVRGILNYMREQAVAIDRYQNNIVLARMFPKQKYYEHFHVHSWECIRERREKLAGYWQQLENIFLYTEVLDPQRDDPEKEFRVFGLFGEPTNPKLKLKGFAFLRGEVRIKDLSYEFNQKKWIANPDSIKTWYEED